MAGGSMPQIPQYDSLPEVPLYGKTNDNNKD